MDHVHHIPFATFGGVDGAQDDVVFVKQRRSGQITGGVRRVERKLAEKTAALVVRPGDALQLLEVLYASLRTAVTLQDDRFAKAANAGDLDRGCRIFGGGDTVGKSSAQFVQAFARCVWYTWWRIHQAHNRRARVPKRGRRGWKGSLRSSGGRVAGGCFRAGGDVVAQSE